MITSKLPDTGTTIFTVMSSLAQQHGAINLSQGFPDFDVDPQLRALVAGAMDDGHNQYAPMQGLPLLREVLAQKILSLYGCAVSPESEITVTAGGTQAIFTAIGAVINPGDEAILFDPSYDCYAPSVRIFGGVPIAIGLHAPDFQIDWDAVERAITPRTRLVMINTPHNPLGRVLTADDIRALEGIVSRHDLYVVSDEVYEHMIFDGLPHRSVLTSEILSKRSFAIYSFGKLVHATGWKVGYCVAPAEIMGEFRKMHQFNVFSVHRPVQHALANYLQDAQSYLGLNQFFQDKRDFFVQAMADTAFRLLPCEGSYFILADYSQISDLDDMTFARKLTTEGGVATIPLSPFYARPEPGQRIVRLCFAKKEETLQEAAALLRAVRQLD